MKGEFLQEPLISMGIKQQKKEWFSRSLTIAVVVIINTIFKVFKKKIILKHSNIHACHFSIEYIYNWKTL